MGNIIYKVVSREIGKEILVIETLQETFGEKKGVESIFHFFQFCNGDCNYFDSYLTYM